jgi:ADP-heptose:LPS heptosyltransferase
VVVLRPDHLGDVLLSRPALELLRAAAPTVEITVVAGPWGVPSLQGLDVRVATFPFPGFVRTASFSGPPPSPRQPATPSPDPYIALLALAARLRRKRYDAALILRPDHWWGALACAAAGIRVRVGYETPETAPFLTHALPQIPPRHAADSALTAARELLHVLGIPPAVAPPAVTFAPSPAAVTAARGWLRSRVGEGRPIVAVHPGAGAPLKTWPAHRWADVVNALGDAATVILTGGPDDAALVAAIHNLAFSAPAVAQDLSWDMLAALYQQMDLTVGMDSGPLHLSAAVGTPTVRVYGPTDPQVYGPAGASQRHHVIHSALPCRPCGNLVSPPCGFLQDPPCLAAVPAEDVVVAARSVLAPHARLPAQ